MGRTLKENDVKGKSFFALIAIEENGAWLSARGQGGALVIWMKDWIQLIYTYKYVVKKVK